eukprot:422346-Rhodomonas_salina.1
MLRITENFLQGVIPGAMVDNFTFWQDLSSGSLHGRKVEKERRNAAGKPEKFTDPWFDYELEVKVGHRSGFPRLDVHIQECIAEWHHNTDHRTHVLIDGAVWRGQIGGAENTRIIRVEEENRSRCLVNLKAVARNSPVTYAFGLCTVCNCFETDVASCAVPGVRHCAACHAARPLEPCLGVDEEREQGRGGTAGGRQERPDRTHRTPQAAGPVCGEARRLRRPAAALQLGQNGLPRAGRPVAAAAPPAPRPVELAAALGRGRDAGDH